MYKGPHNLTVVDGDGFSTGYPYEGIRHEVAVIQDYLSDSIIAISEHHFEEQLRFINATFWSGTIQGGTLNLPDQELIDCAYSYTMSFFGHLDTTGDLARPGDYIYANFPESLFALGQWLVEWVAANERRMGLNHDRFLAVTYISKIGQYYIYTKG